jgi:hypothetical protein
MIDLNSFYHRAKEKGLVRDEKVRLTIVNGVNPKVGVCLKVLLDYNLTTNEPGDLKQYAYAATILFNELSQSEYGRIVDSSIIRHGRGDKALEAASVQLLSRNDVVFVTKDEAILKHPLVNMKVGAIKGVIYGGGGINGATYDAIAHLQKDVTGAFAFENKLYEPVNPAWLNADKKKARDRHSEMTM